jgi:hypothetical protein
MRQNYFSASSEVHAKQIRAVLAKYDAIIKKAAEEDGEGVWGPGAYSCQVVKSARSDYADELRFPPGSAPCGDPCAPQGQGQGGSQ